MNKPKKFTRGMMVEIERRSANPYTVQWIMADGQARCEDGNGNLNRLLTSELEHATLLPESIYEGQKWESKANMGCNVLCISAISDSFDDICFKHVGDHDGCHSLPRGLFLQEFTPIPDEPEKMIEINGKKVSESTAALALEQYFDTKGK